ncbi:proteasome inhibitor PI31 subunit [Carcharodon carcharias]|uniref:proteasome inhibitor PI31 subunit n=1 Tax=Carcharodon carcharias TaxID=13397 RepID=UPI001B7F329B|nr:proteasome inhibitor PI31 subunit [Carcharodon carcharias]
MAGLELLYHSVARDVVSPQDALICFIHWELVRAGFKCLGTGDQASTDEKKKELLPTGWNVNQELYTLRYSSANNQKVLLLKAITVDSSLIVNVMNCQSEQVVDLTVNLDDYISSDHLQQYDRVFKKEEELRSHIESTIVSPLVGTKQRAGGGPQKGKKPVHSVPGAQPHTDTNPLFIPPNTPQRQPPWSDPMAPFVSGGDDLDPFSDRRGGMIVDPLRSGVPNSGFDPSSGIPGRLPPGSVPPGARFDPFGPVGPSRSGPDPDHLPPPGYDDLFM